MNNFAPPPLPPRELYILLTLTQAERYGYGIRHAVNQLSLGAVTLTDSRTYPLLAKLMSDGLIEAAGVQPAGASYIERKHYRLSNLGRIRLEEEYARLDDALKIMAAAGIGQPELPPEIQRLLETVR